MTELARDRGTRAAEPARTPTVWDPMRPTWADDPMAPLAPLRMLSPQMSRLLDQLFTNWPGLPAATEVGAPTRLETPLGDIEELDDAWLIRLEVPGVRREDVDIQISGRRLQVRAERKETERKGLLRRNTRTMGRYSVDIVLPGEVNPDDVDATLESGVLTIRVGKPEAERAESRRIAISAPGATEAGTTP